MAGGLLLRKRCHDALTFHKDLLNLLLASIKSLL